MHWYRYCEKYPRDKDCLEAVEVMPMMLVVPPFFTWDMNSSALLGLGDMVIPGKSSLVIPIFPYVVSCQCQVYKSNLAI